MDADAAAVLSGPADGSLPSKQEEVTAAQSAPVRQENPVDRLLDCVPDAYTPKLDRSAMRTLRREHAHSSLINPISMLLRTSPGSARIFGHRPARRFSLVGGALFGSGALIRASAHLLLAKDYRASLLGVVTAFQKPTAH
jgi:hypothetical protein